MVSTRKEISILYRTAVQVQSWVSQSRRWQRAGQARGEAEMPGPGPGPEPGPGPDPGQVSGQCPPLSAP